MNGSRNGVRQALTKREYPQAHLSHCYAHQLNLVVKRMSSDSLVCLSVAMMLRTSDGTHHLKGTKGFAWRQDWADFNISCQRML